MNQAGKKIWKRRVCAAVWLVMFAGSIPAQTAGENAGAVSRDTTLSELRVEILDGFVSLDARNVSLKDLLYEIVRQGRLELFVQGPLEERLSVEINRLPLPEALHAILRHHDFALQYDDEFSTANHTGKQYQGRLWLYASDSMDIPVNIQNAGENSLSADAHVALQHNARSIGRTGPVHDVDEDIKYFAESETRASMNLAIDDEKPKTHADAIAVLADTGGEQAIDAISAALDDADSRVREEAVYALGQLDDKKAFLALEQAIKDEDSDVREAAFAVFTEIGGDESIRILADALREHDTEIRIQALNALGDIGGGTAIGLLQVAVTDSDSDVRETAAEILADLPVRN